MGDLLHWLEQHKEYPKFFFRDRDTHKNLAAVGAGGQSSWQVGACQFLGTPFFFSPKEIREEEGTITPANLHLPFTLREDIPSKETWIERVEEALHHIRQENFAKVVLARKTTLHMQEPVSPYAILRYLCNQAKRATCFLLEMSPGHAFLGATPEKLYTREGNKLVVEAVAGTSPLGGILGGKEHREFTFVKMFIEERLSPYCDSISWKEDRILQTTHVQHFYNRCLAILHEKITDSRLIDLIHPTPAVAGLPQQEALGYLKRYEAFDRGWYAAPIGWIKPDSANLAVGIRSAEIVQGKMHLFAGAGIVEGSNPEQEWNELELKISQYVR